MLLLFGGSAFYVGGTPPRVVAARKAAPKVSARNSAPRIKGIR